MFKIDTQAKRMMTGLFGIVALLAGIGIVVGCDNPPPKNVCYTADTRLYAVQDSWGGYPSVTNLEATGAIHCEGETGTFSAQESIEVGEKCRISHNGTRVSVACDVWKQVWASLSQNVTRHQGGDWQDIGQKDGLGASHICGNHRDLRAYRSKVALQMWSYPVAKVDVNDKRPGKYKARYSTPELFRCGA